MIQSPEFKFQDVDDKGKEEEGGCRQFYAADDKEQEYANTLEEMKQVKAEEQDAMQLQHVEDKTQDIGRHLREHETEKFHIQDQANNQSEEEERPVK